MRLLAHVLRAFEHHVLEEVREAGASGLLIHRPDVIPEIDRHQRKLVVFIQDHFKAIWQRVLFIRQHRHHQRFCWRQRRRSRRSTPATKSHQQSDHRRSTLHQNSLLLGHGASRSCPDFIPSAASDRRKKYIV